MARFADKLMDAIRWAVVRRFTALDTIVLCSTVLASSRGLWGQATFICIVGTLLSKYIEREVERG